MIAKLGEGGWKGLYSVVSLVGFVLIVWGFGLARQQPVLLYVPPVALKHANALFTLDRIRPRHCCLCAAQPPQAQDRSSDAGRNQGLGLRPPAGHRLPA